MFGQVGKCVPLFRDARNIFYHHHQFKTITSDIRMKVWPKSGLVDEPLHVQVSGLKPYERVTLYSTLEESSKRFGAIGHFCADIDGRVNTEHQASFGGDFVGYEPEGLIWAMKPLPNQEGVIQRIIKENVSTPFAIDIKLLKGCVGHEEALQSKPVASENFERWYRASYVSRTPVRHGNIRGTLYMPEGIGPFPPLIDLFGGAGGLKEHRAALLASRGYAVLALAHFAFDDLPEDPGALPMEYFEEAVNWLLHHNSRIVTHGGVGVIGIYFGGLLALGMSEFIPEVKAVVCINGLNCPLLHPMTYKDVVRNPVPMDKSKKRYAADGALIMANVIPHDLAFDPNCAFKIENSNAQFLFLVGELDDRVHPTWSHNAAERLKRVGKNNYELIVFPGAGHLIEPPYAPFGNRGIVRGKLLAYGGEPLLHAHAQNQSWKSMLSFLKTVMIGRKKSHLSTVQRL